MDHYNFRKLKQKGYITRNSFVSDLERECFYFTAYRNGLSVISPEIKKLKRKQYFSWYADAIKKRLEIYEEKTSPLIDFYKNKGVLRTEKISISINRMGTDVANDIVNDIKK